MILRHIISIVLSLLLSVLFTAETVYAQAVIPRPIVPRNGDCLRVAVGAPVRLAGSGSDNVWALSDSYGGNTAQMSFTVSGDTVNCIFQGMVYEYGIINDCLSSLSFANRLQTASFSPCGEKMPLTLLVGDSISSVFTQDILYSERIKMRADGETKTIVAATGIAICGADTLKDASLAKIRTIYTVTPVIDIPTDSIDVQVDSLPAVSERITDEKTLLYAKGYRYPIVITRQTSTNGVKAPDYSIVYLPQWQCEDLAADPDNEALRENRVMADRESLTPGNTNGDQTPSHGIYSAVWNDDNTVSVTYTVADGTATVRLVICDASGRPVDSASYERIPGTYTETIAMPSTFTGNAAIIMLTVGNDAYTLKILR